MALTKTLTIGSATFEFPTKTSELTNDSSFVNQLKTINNQSLIGEGNLDIATAQTQVDWNETDTTSVKYINNKPTIPSKTSDLTNDSSFITNTVDNLTNYYNKTTVDSMISGIVTMSILVVDALPTTGAEKTIYLVKKTTETTSNIYNEYLWVNSKWELIGDTSVDLSNYYTKDEADSAFIKSVKTINGNSIVGTGDLELPNKALTIIDVTSETYLTDATFKAFADKVLAGENPIGAYALDNGSYPFICSQCRAKSPYIYLAFVEDASTNGSCIAITLQMQSDGTYEGTWRIHQGLANYYDKSEVDAKIPTVNDASLKISVNGTEKGTFTANDADDLSIELTIPTATTSIVVTDADGNSTTFNVYTK